MINQELTQSYLKIPILAMVYLQSQVPIEPLSFKKGK